MQPISTILIVDDQAIGREALEALLSNPEYRLAFAGSGLETLQQAAALIPDLILLDVMMPGMDGFEVCRRLRADPMLAEVPVIMVTALDDQASRLQGIEAGADDFISKPFNRAELRARVRTITRLNRYRRLLAQRTRFEWVVEQSNDGYIILEADDQVRYANPKARLLLGIDESADLADLKFRELVQRKYRLRPENNWDAWLSGRLPDPDVSQYFVRPENAAAGEFWLKADVLAVPGADVAERLVRLQDVTDQLTSQRDLWSVRGAIRHKFATPLMPLLGSLEMLNRRILDMTPEEAADLLEMAKHSAEQLHGVVADLLQYTSVSHSDMSGSGFNTIRIVDLARDIAATMQPVPHIQVVQDVVEALLPLTQQAIEAILWEILENAVRFHPTRTPLLELSVQSPNPGWVVLSLRDDGKTLAPEQLARVWDPYYQGEKNFTGSVPGSGLGLPLVASLVWSCGGRCQITNRTDRPGVVVSLTLPTIETARAG